MCMKSFIWCCKTKIANAAVLLQGICAYLDVHTSEHTYLVCLGEIRTVTMLSNESAACKALVSPSIALYPFISHHCCSCHVFGAMSTLAFFLLWQNHASAVLPYQNECQCALAYMGSFHLLDMYTALESHNTRFLQLFSFLDCIHDVSLTVLFRISHTPYHTTVDKDLKTIPHFLSRFQFQWTVSMWSGKKFTSAYLLKWGAQVLI